LFTFATYWPITSEPIEPIYAFSPYWTFNFPFHITWENVWGISHGPFYLFFQIKIIRMDFSQLGFLEVAFLRDLETVFWKVYSL
jgi:hypothetical protein